MTSLGYSTYVKFKSFGTTTHQSINMETTEQPQSTQSIKMEETIDQPSNQQVGQDPIMPESTNITDSKPNNTCSRLNIVLPSVNVMLMLLLTVCIALVMYRQHTMNSEHEDLEKLVKIIDERTKAKLTGAIEMRQAAGSSSGGNAVASPGQIRQGYVNCGGYPWRHGYYGSRFVVVDFNPNFERAPIVFLSVREFRSALDEKYVLIHYRASEVSRTHTTIECVKSLQDGDIPFFYVNWIAFPQ